MSEYRTTATLTAEGTFVVPGPEGLPAGTRAEVTVRVEEASSEPKRTLEEFFRRLESRPPDPDGARRAEEAQAFLRTLRVEWD